MASAGTQEKKEGKPNLSGKLKSMAFMQRASKKKDLQQLQAKAAAEPSKDDEEEQPSSSTQPSQQEGAAGAANTDSGAPSTSGSCGQPPQKKGCRVVYQGAPLPGALAGGRFSFGGFNPQTEKLYAERTGTPLPSRADREQQDTAAQDAKRGTDLPVGQMVDMASAFQRGGKEKGPEGGKKRKERS